VVRKRSGELSHLNNPKTNLHHPHLVEMFLSTCWNSLQTNPTVLSYLVLVEVVRYCSKLRILVKLEEYALIVKLALSVAPHVLCQMWRHQVLQSCFQLRKSSLRSVDQRCFRSGFLSKVYRYPRADTGALSVTLEPGIVSVFFT